MKTDAELRSDVAHELDGDPSAQAAGFEVMVKNGVVTLAGCLGSLADRLAMERAVHRVFGVRGVAMELNVKLSEAQPAVGAELFDGRAMYAGPQDEPIELPPESGWVTLMGEVDWKFHRDQAERTVHTQLGVRGLSHNIGIARRIETALARQTAREARRIQVSLFKGVVTLQGRVHSLAEREAATLAAMAADGVTGVVNQLSVDT